ncbi:hypothetical protein CNMCM6106_003879 [Aspergillus hiratsukae]|uniref:Uncharacterized protein n=1 Tax=Aspergillus hiratsukae TaxID=1194566 RepID=A0A8H6QAH1_9EURO|nr:hypothetical protein CNMCM6106_003879 [Aspergillus hiratsukae]
MTERSLRAVRGPVPPYDPAYSDSFSNSFVRYHTDTHLWPSYTHLPPCYENLQTIASSSTATGRGNQHNEKRPWGDALVQLIDLLGQDNVFLSLYESNSGQKGCQALEALSQWIQSNKSIGVDEQTTFDAFLRVMLPKGEKPNKRIGYVAALRNCAQRPLDEQTQKHIKYDKLLYSNDDYFNPVEALQLLFCSNSASHRISQTANRYRDRAARAVDFRNPFKFYDSYATRDLAGYGIGMPSFPWFTTAADGRSRADVLVGRDAVSVRSCWGGMVAFDAWYFQKEQPVRFQAGTQMFWDASESCLVHVDVQDAGSRGDVHGDGDTGVYMNPFVRVAYTARTLAWLRTRRRFDALSGYPYPTHPIRILGRIEIWVKPLGACHDPARFLLEASPIVRLAEEWQFLPCTSPTQQRGNKANGSSIAPIGLRFFINTGRARLHSISANSRVGRPSSQVLYRSRATLLDSGVIVKFRPRVEKAARDRLCCGSAHVVAGPLAGYKESGRQAPEACKTKIWGNPCSGNAQSQLGTSNRASWLRIKRNSCQWKSTVRRFYSHTRLGCARALANIPLLVLKIPFTSGEARRLSSAVNLLRFAVPTAVAAKKGGGGSDLDSSTSSDGDSSSDPEGTSTIGGSSSTCSGTSDVLYKTDLLPINAYNWTSNAPGSNSENPTTYDGSYFQGEASMDFRFTAGKQCQNATGTVRMLGYAWVGPQPPYPKGPTNPIIIGFKAWQSADPLENITFSYDFLDDGLYCPTAPDLVKFQTSAGWTDFQASVDIPRADRARAHDVVALDLAPDAERQDTVLFNGSMVPDLKPEPQYSVEILLPGSACNHRTRLSLGYKEVGNITGSLTNTTLELSIAGEGNVSTPYMPGSLAGVNARATFNITFSGTFDGINSTRAVAIKQDTQPMVFWVDNSAIMYASVSWKLKLIFVGWIAWSFC